ncbi:outer membrane autotransporter protein [Rhodoblastus acidophilus]|uniref:autotransporter family protein n=1 Tax=Rhodoblastus acidophilus TaxID=1074 RepID=UPI0022249CFB|nr:autotransporter domain-containing protein [Rhodoblastus acidophilus]MCW2285637.1 outer membrane autotransporter protein [Rhodoblastus acidophilus]MCW2334605.1 outer membrane autotransporter protein [Rhodoblastus acidophilus]
MSHFRTRLLASVAGAAMIAHAHAGQFVNGGFEAGTLTGWTQGGGVWSSGDYPVPADYLPGGRNYVANSAAITIMNPGYDPNTDDRLATVYSGGHSVMINNPTPDNSVSVLSQRVSAYTDSHISFAFAAVLESSHGLTDSDSFIVTATDATLNKVIYSYNINSANAPGLFNPSQLQKGWYYSNWMTQYINVGRLAGHDFVLSILANDCPYGAHAGYAYLDNVGSAVPPVSGDGIQYWNGAAKGPTGALGGGDGTWTALSQNWTDNTGVWGGALNPLVGGPVFAGPKGTVKVSNSNGQVSIGAAQFLTDGYVIKGDPIRLRDGTVWVAVGDGSNQGYSDITATIDAPLFGGGGLTKVDNGVLVLNGVNTYTGVTTADTGTLIGSATSFGKGQVMIYDKFVIDQPTAANFDNLISGWGSFEKRGAGMLTLTAASDFWGDTLVSAGELRVQGALSGSTVTVGAGGKLSGAGTVGGVVAQAGAVVAPGTGALDRLTVAGDYIQQKGADLQIQVKTVTGNSGLTVAGAAKFDPAGGAKLDITNLDLANAQKIDRSNYWILENRYPILTAAKGVSGAPSLAGPTFVSAFYDLKVNTDQTHVYLDVAQTTAFDAFARTRNQRAAAQGLDSVNKGELYNAIGYLGTAAGDPRAEARRAYDAISGEVYASARTVMIEDSRIVRDTFVLRLSDAEDADVSASLPLGYAPTQTAFPALKDAPATASANGAWIQGFDTWGSNASDGNAMALTHRTGGVLFGYDNLLGDLVRVGVAGGLSQTAFDVADRAAKGTSDNWHAGVYAGTRLNGWGLKAGAAWTASNFSVARTAAFDAASNAFYPGYSNRLSGRGRDSTAQAFGDLSYRMRAGAAWYEPYDNLAYVSVNSDPFTETGGAAALHAVSNDTRVAFNTLGVRAAYAYNVGAAVSTLRGELGWQHAFGDLAPQQMLKFVGGSAFTIYGAPVAENAMVVKGAVDVALTDSLFVTARYGAQLAKSANDQSVKGAMAYKF